NRPEVDTTKSTVPVIYRFIDGKAVATPVSIGASDMTHTVIRSGLAAGDVIITGPYKVLESLKDGQKLKREEASTSKPSTAPSTAPSTSPSSQPSAAPATAGSR
ncbi:MAG TPA: hypothetical protein VH475_15415, partial [Tepidisphaeraceae bacterium]